MNQTLLVSKRAALTLFAAAAGLALTTATAGEGTVTSLFDFSQSGDASQWQIVNDGVMGGRSTSQAAITEAGEMRFKGNLSLANNGGFASVRSRPKTLPLQRGQAIVMRVKGDGRKYKFNLYTPDRRMAYSFQSDFKTVAGQWTEIRLPVDGFVANSFGRARPQDRLDPARVQSVGILLGDKRPGAFELLIDSIGVE